METNVFDLGTGEVKQVYCEGVDYDTSWLIGVIEPYDMNSVDEANGRTLLERLGKCQYEEFQWVSWALWSGVRSIAVKKGTTAYKRTVAFLQELREANYPIIDDEIYEKVQQERFERDQKLFTEDFFNFDDGMVEKMLNNHAFLTLASCYEDGDDYHPYNIIEVILSRLHLVPDAGKPEDLDHWDRLDEGSQQELLAYQAALPKEVLDVGEMQVSSDPVHVGFRDGWVAYVGDYSHPRKHANTVWVERILHDEYDGDDTIVVGGYSWLKVGSPAYVWLKKLVEETDTEACFDLDLWGQLEDEEVARTVRNNLLKWLEANKDFPGIILKYRAAKMIKIYLPILSLCESFGSGHELEPDNIVQLVMEDLYEVEGGSHESLRQRASILFFEEDRAGIEHLIKRVTRRKQALAKLTDKV